ncbi:MAG TPA: RdgB/HAM1 family non-canonical purine NTP pyrophosphatase [Hanamia sp.]
MKTLIFATNNDHKVAEVKSILNRSFRVLSLKEAGIDIDIPEPYSTLEENAGEKAKVINLLTGEDCFSEDTGLEVNSLNGEPGVKSARYAGENRSFENNIDKLLLKLEDQENRTAQFRTVICLRRKGKENFFEGVCKGTIIAERKGSGGFGYDAVFIPKGANKTFSEMSLEEKNLFSHRRKAMDILITFLLTEEDD